MWSRHYKRVSNTITIGASGDTVSLASGASQSGFGRTGTVIGKHQY